MQIIAIDKKRYIAGVLTGKLLMMEATKAKQA